MQLLHHPIRNLLPYWRTFSLGPSFIGYRGRCVELGNALCVSNDSHHHLIFGKLSDEKHIGPGYGSNNVRNRNFRDVCSDRPGGGITFLGGFKDVATQTRYANIGNFIATNAWINLVLGILFIFFALWMFGVINVNVAGWLLNRTDRAGQVAKSAYLGSLLLGVAFAITSFSCTVPVVGSLLVVAASGTASGLFTSLMV
ncbi:MAG: hypothetical protein Ct9H300mP9_8000 [Candidatus Neomarinimicrobiota bacterium]|nr:MAG: hypothetical protein Ct9H300mP9_8000 [Candidatus Neomarinimicrobiota bacterium]